MTVQPTPEPQRSNRELIAEQQLPIVRGPDGYSGRGWDRLIEDGAAAQFFMVGEQHATADIAQFEAALHAALAARGYSHGALEVGPYSTQFAEALIRSGRGRLAEYIARPGHGFTIPFLFFQDEAAMAEQIVASSPDREHALWGLDQEFVGSAPIAAELLGRWATTAEQRRAAAAFAARAEADPMLVGSLTAADLDPLAAAFAGNPDASGLVAALRLSSQIYDPYIHRNGPTYPANLRRENYMKLNFLRQFEATQQRLGRPPRVFLKFGGYHAMRGFTGTNVPGLANFLAEWGLSRGFGFVNMMVDCASGQALDPQTSEVGPCEPYFGNDTVIGSMPRNEPLTLIDLRPLRARLGQMTDLDPLSRQTILAFDYYLVIRDVRAAAPVATPPTRR
ncbi:MAG TPA: hypothetical protein VGX37_01375 [Allosphingosinicella sp.]|nr:hypothetical protein [Allosphingosinicella sp.]